MGRVRTKEREEVGESQRRESQTSERESDGPPLSTLAEGKSFPLIHPVNLTSLQSARTENRHIGVNPYMGRKEREGKREIYSSERENHRGDRQTSERDTERDKQRT